jgi:hypothetical protein
MDPWQVTIALKDIARRLNYGGTLTGVAVVARGPSERATSISLAGSIGEKVVTGLQFDSSLGLKSTLFDVKVVMVSKVAGVTGESTLQLPPEQAPAVTESPAEPTLPAASPAVPVRVAAATEPASHVGAFSLVAAALWGAVVVSAFRWRRRGRLSIDRLLS